MEGTEPNIQETSLWEEIIYKSKMKQPRGRKAERR